MPQEDTTIVPQEVIEKTAHQEETMENKEKEEIQAQLLASNANNRDIMLMHVQMKELKEKEDK